MIVNEHTGSVPNVASSSPVVRERKRKPDGSWHEYDLEAVVHTPGLVVGRFPLPRGIPPGGRLPISLPPGSASDGYFWAARPYVVYRFRGPGGEARAHRIDAVANVRISGRTVSYRDLALDWWVLGDGTVLEEDRDEFDDLVRAGALSARDVEHAARAERAVRHRWAAVVADLRRIEAASFRDG